MFKQLLTVCDQNNIIATEWEYIDEQMCSKIVSSYHIGNKHFTNSYIEYVTDDKDLNLDKIDLDVINKNILINKPYQIFHIDFSKTDLMKRFKFNYESDKLL